MNKIKNFLIISYISGAVLFWIHLTYFHPTFKYVNSSYGAGQKFAASIIWFFGKFSIPTWVWMGAIGVGYFIAVFDDIVK